MQIGIVGLGRMGGNIARRLMRNGHECVGYNRSMDKANALIDEGLSPAGSISELAAKLRAPRVVWVMVPAGPATESVIEQLGGLLERDDVVIDGGNTHYKDDLRRFRQLGEKGIHYLDVGTSGGVWGLERGYCMMIGGDEAVFRRLDPVFKALAPGRGRIPPTPGRDGSGSAEEGYLHCGPAGAGHFVKMIHNGIEYGLMQAYAEGFDILQSAGSEELPQDLRYDLNVADIAEVWRRGSVIGSWLLDLTAAALAEDAALSEYSGHVQDSGEGRWALKRAIEGAVPANVLSAALYARFRSRRDSSFADKVLSAMRDQFGGHTEPRQAER